METALDDPDREITLYFTAEEEEQLKKTLLHTQWVEQPFCEAVVHLEREWNQSKNNVRFQVGGRQCFFASNYILQSTDEYRRSLPMTKVIGLLWSFEHQRDFEKRGQSWFDSTVKNLFTIMKGLPPEHDAAFLELLKSMNPDADRLISGVARKAAYARHKGTNQQKAAALAEWEADGHSFSSMRAFARNRYKKYGVTDFMTVYNWLRESRKNKDPA